MEGLKILSARYKGGYCIEIDFSDGEKKIVDFGPFLRLSKHPEIRKYLRVEEFKKFKVVEGDLDWNDFDLTFPIWDLYQNKILKNGNKEKDQQAS